MTKLTRAAAAAVALGALAGTGGCRGDKCERAFDQFVDLAVAMARDATKSLGDGDAIAEALDKAKAQFDRRKPAALEKCRAALEKEPEKVGAALECIIDAGDLAALKACGGDFLTDPS